MFNRLRRWLASWWTPAVPPLAVPSAQRASPGPPTPPSVGRLERVVLTEQVAQTLFEDFAVHRGTDRGEEEIGWTLLGLRQGSDAIAMATLPAGTQRDSGLAHVQFNCEAQAIGSLIVRQLDKRLVTLGMVHTHPGSLRHPSGGDYRGDIEWVQQHRGGEAIFGIGTADARDENPTAHQQIEGELCFSWYALHEGDSTYRRLSVSMMSGPDLARPLHPVWETLEHFALPLQRLAHQLTRVVFEALHGTLVVTLNLADPGHRLRVVLQNDEVRYYVEQGSQVSAVNPDEPSLERAVYLILAELAKPAARAASYSAQR